MKLNTPRSPETAEPKFDKKKNEGSQAVKDVVNSTVSKVNKILNK